MSKLLELEQKLQEITAEIEKLKNPNSRARSWDRVSVNEEYFCITNDGVWYCDDEFFQEDDDNYNDANYNTDSNYIERIKFEQDLFRKLKRFADQNNEGEVDWDNGDQPKYAIGWRETGFDFVTVYKYKDFGQVYFTSVEIRQKAIETFKTELLEYFGT